MAGYITTLIVFRTRVSSAFLWTYHLTGSALQSDCFANFNPTVLKMLMGENEERKSRNPVTLVFHPIIFDTFSFDSMYFSPYMQDLRLILYLHTQHECRRSIQFAPPESAFWNLLVEQICIQSTPVFEITQHIELGNYTIGSCNCLYAALALCKNTIVSNISLSTRISPFGCSIK